MRTKLLGALMVFGIIICTAHASSKLEITAPRAAKIEDIVKLPIKGGRAVQSDGQIIFLSENRRFVISGQIYDLRSKKPLNTMSQMREVAERIHFKSMGLDVDTLNAVSMEHGDKEVVVFVEPRVRFTISSWTITSYTLVSSPYGPLTRRYAPTSGKPSSGPLRPRT
ncbi:disulfide isomerase DsbC N-terminal domain-containing protein [Escherichia coli]|uniref:disulfide isomerase DsbC N-terminal domain-containing protein n=1 Tax=Escherichia coli TaxID=562 RepID=UPI003C745B3D